MTENEELKKIIKDIISVIDKMSDDYLCGICEREIGGVNCDKCDWYKIRKKAIKIINKKNGEMKE